MKYYLKAKKCLQNMQHWQTKVFFGENLCPRMLHAKQPLHSLAKIHYIDLARSEAWKNCENTSSSQLLTGAHLLGQKYRALLLMHHWVRLWSGPWMLLAAPGGA